MFNKKWLIIISLYALLIVFLFLSFLWIKQLKLDNEKLATNNSILGKQLERVQEAFSLREDMYKQIEESNDELTRKLEELKDAESIKWIESEIPAAVDDTIPY